MERCRPPSRILVRTSRQHLPGSARATSRRRVRARVAFTPMAKGQKGVRKVVQSGAGALSFNPGSVLSKMMNVTKNKINWKILDDAADKLDGELASQPILGLVRAEVTIRGIDALEAEGRGYKEYILLRSLGLKAWFTHATSRAGVHDPLTRCAVGKNLADPNGEFNIYRRVLAHAPAAAAGDWDNVRRGWPRGGRPSRWRMRSPTTSARRPRTGTISRSTRPRSPRSTTASRRRRRCARGRKGATRRWRRRWRCRGSIPARPQS